MIGIVAGSRGRFRPQPLAGKRHERCEQAEMDRASQRMAAQQQYEPDRDEAERKGGPPRAALHREEPSRRSDQTGAEALAAVSMDVNGTLIHTPHMAEIYADVLSRHGMDVDPERLGESFREVWDEFECHRQLGHERYGRGPDDARHWWLAFLTRL